LPGDIANVRPERRFNPNARRTTEELAPPPQCHWSHRNNWILLPRYAG